MVAHNPRSHASRAHDDANAPRKYAMILVVLLILTVVTVLASQVQFGSGFLNVVVALVIATVKASLVALFFMHLLHDKPLNGIILVASFVFLGIFLISCYTDQATRDPIQPSNLKVQTGVPAPAPPVGASGGTPAAQPQPAH
ncbi:MAG: cytochrome C oxidase subunit IV family protein [Bryobacteraceae bacterium]